MSEFKVKISNMKSTVQQQNTIARQMKDLEYEIQKIQNGLSFEIAQKERIRQRLTTARKEIAKEYTGIDKATKALDNSINIYETTEAKLSGAEVPKKDLYDNLVSGDNQEQQKNNFNMEKWMNSKKDSDWFSWISKLLSMENPIWGKTLSIFSSGFTMFENFTSGEYTSKNIFKNLLNYSKDASDLWNGAYDTIEAYYKHIDKLAGIKKGENGLEKQWGNTTAGKAATVLSFISPFLDFGKQAINSYQKYSADGSMDVNDWASLMIDSSISGLFDVAGGFISLIPIVGIPVSMAYNEWLEQGNVAENVSNCIKNWATDTGKSLRKYIAEWSTADLKNDNMIVNLLSARYNHIKSDIYDLLYSNDNKNQIKSNDLNRYFYN